MAKKKKPAAPPASASQNKPATLKDLLNPDVLNKLKANADEWKAEEAKRKEEKRKQEEEARRADRKRLENDFQYLLDNSSPEWKKYK